MANLLKEPTQKDRVYTKEEFAEYTALMERYFLETGRAFPNRLLDEQKYLTFFANIQSSVERELRIKFYQHGYRLVKICPSALNQPSGLYYKIVYAKNVFDFRLTDQHLCLTEIIQEVCTNTVESGESCPDIKIVDSAYLQKKIADTVEKAYAKFMEKLLTINQNNFL